jgi:predicted ferric reductase
MRNLKRSFWGVLLLLAGLWLIAEPGVFQSTTLMSWRATLIQLTGVIAIGCISVEMVLALRPRWPEAFFGGLDKMYRLHKWLGIAALAASVTHWLCIKAPKWALSWGLLDRLARGPRGSREPLTSPVEAWFAGFRSPAEDIGEWAFYAAVALIVLALMTRIPYRWFYKTHRLLALVYLALAFHTVALLKFNHWMMPIGWLLALLLLAGTWAGMVVLLRRVGASRKAAASITALRYFPGVRALEIETQVQNWPGHKPGQFVFATSNVDEGAHPYTIASGWQAQDSRIRFVVKELGDHTDRLNARLRVGQQVTLEGPYGCFTFDDDCPRQIWIGGGIGITPFIGRMQHLSAHPQHSQQIDLFHATADVDAQALDKLRADAQAAAVHLHVLIDARDGLLTGARIREQVPDWRKASIWFCGPAAFGQAVKRDFAAQGFPVEQRFHQELFTMR